MSRYDAIVVGGGPAGSVAALVLARGGARVALVDKASFPRDKACGDLVGPRGVQVLADLGLPPALGRDVSEIVVVGPTGRRVQLPCGQGLTYPGHGTAVTRTVFDAALHDAATAAGADAVVGRAVEPLELEGHIDGYRLSTGVELRADFVVGADGATSGVGTAAALVDPTKVLWGFAVRMYLPDPVDRPAIVFWEPTPWRGFPGYGWVFPGASGGANVGLGLGTLADRKAGAQAQQLLPGFLAHLRALELLEDTPLGPPPRRLGGWLKMGMVGTTPATGSVFLVGDAAGLVNPLQGEGISQAMSSGRSAAEAILGEPARAAHRYRATLAADHLPYHRVAAAVQAGLAGRPRTVATVARLLVTAGYSDGLAGGWSVLWNELLDGAPPNRHRAVAAALTRLGEVMTARTSTARWFRATFPAAPAELPGDEAAAGAWDSGHPTGPRQRSDAPLIGVSVGAAVPSDREDILAVVARAFRTGGRDGSEEVEIVRQTWAVAGSGTIDLVARDGDAVIGHVLGAGGVVGDARVIGLAPLSVAPGWQGRGVGSALMAEFIRRAAGAQWPLVVLLGDRRYYARFGFEPAASFGIVYQPAGPGNPNFMARRLPAFSGACSGSFRYCWEQARPA